MYRASLYVKNPQNYTSNEFVLLNIFLIIVIEISLILKTSIDGIILVQHLVYIVMW